MIKSSLPNLRFCKECAQGSCCYLGVELDQKELFKIVKFNPNIRKPWFRVVEYHEDFDGTHHFSTIRRDGACVFQDKNNRCVIYSVRPHFCREFPLEQGKTAPHYHHLCRIFEKTSMDPTVKKICAKRKKHS
jgi:Fe-S-cluster containining protein